jgi:hypothetical protein
MRRVTARMVESTRKVPGIMCALQDNSAAPLDAAQLPPLKLWPIIAAVGLLVFVLMVDGAVIVVTLHFIGEPMFKAMPWTVLYFGHTGILLAALLCIALLATVVSASSASKLRPIIDMSTPPCSSASFSGS